MICSTITSFAWSWPGSTSVAAHGPTTTSLRLASGSAMLLEACVRSVLLAPAPRHRIGGLVLGTAAVATLVALRQVVINCLLGALVLLARARFQAGPDVVVA